VIKDVMASVMFGGLARASPQARKCAGQNFGDSRTASWKLLERAAPVLLVEERRS
jgi:hypothetical protein